MKVAINSDDNSLHLASAILLYEDRQSRTAYASGHTVSRDEQGKLTIEAGAGISATALNKAYTDLLGHNTLHFLEERVLAYNGHTLLCWFPPMERSIYFDAPEPMGKRQGMVPHPGLVLLVSPSTEPRFFAVKGNQRPTANTPLFHAPYLNIYGSDGAICMGNVKEPDCSPAAIDEWESVFFNSHFTHANAGTKVRYPGGIYSLWVDLLEGTLQTFPEDALISRQGNPGDYLLSQLLERAMP